MLNMFITLPGYAWAYQYKQITDKAMQLRSHTVHLVALFPGGCLAVHHTTSLDLYFF